MKDKILRWMMDHPTSVYYLLLIFWIIVLFIGKKLIESL